MLEVRVTYDKTVDAAYVHLTEPQTPVKSTYMYPCDPVDVDGMINLDFDEQGRLIGIEVLAASTKLPPYLLQSAEQPNSRPPKAQPSTTLAANRPKRAQDRDGPRHSRSRTA
ncbi:DUF2283 domain-containing protein [Streptomyces sp. NPDC005529]|uniref:DUF2283 domain-containing protein n=1 Tax=unclassified Streptomyces TaxID=2593676 RepID=UPI0033BF2C2E